MNGTSTAAPGTVPAAHAERAERVIGPIVNGKALTSSDALDLLGVDGSLLARIHTAPSLMAKMAIRKIREQDRIPHDRPRLPFDSFPRAADLFATATLGGESPEECQERFSLSTGVPISVGRTAFEDLARLLAGIEIANRADLPQPAPVPGYISRWIPRGRLFASVVTLGGHPLPNAGWVRALSLGYRVIVRTGHRDPFTPVRLFHALSQAGIPAELMSLLPGDDDVGQLLLRECDAGVVFGPPPLTDPWRSSQHVVTHGPGSSKVYVQGPLSERKLDALVAHVVGEGGVRCDNASVILTSGDVADVAERLADRLRSLPLQDVRNPSARLPAVSWAGASSVRALLARLSQGLRRHTPGDDSDDWLAPLPDGSLAVLPTLLSTDDLHHPTVGTELTWPFAVVAPWKPADGFEVLGRTLVLSLLDGHERTAAQALHAANIQRVVCGCALPWSNRLDVPGDELATTLMVRRTMVCQSDGAYRAAVGLSL